MENRDAEYCLSEGNKFYDSGKYEEAIKCYEEAIQLDPKNASAFHNWGFALYNLAEDKKDKEREDLLNSAFEKFDEATKLDPKNASAFHNWGFALYNLAEDKKGKEGEYLLNSAFEKFDEATKLDPKNADAFHNWGIVLYNLAEYKKDKEGEYLLNSAFEKFDEATKLDPKNADAFHNCGFILSKLAEINKDENLFQNAFEKFEKAIELKQPDISVSASDWGNAIYALVEINKGKSLQKNFETFEKASKDIKDTDTLLIKGKLYSALYQMEKKSEYLKKAEECFKESKKDILEILTSLNRDGGKEIIKTKILHSLLDFSNNDTFFKETTKNLTPEQLDEYKEVYIHSIFIISLLHITNENEKLVAHYSKKEVSQKLLFDSTSKFRLNAINYSNDPTEGKTLLEFLYGKEKRPSDEKLNTEYEAFAGCFTFNYDSLNQFRLYGKEDGKEGTGLSLVFRNNFFSEKAEMALKQPKTDSNNINNNDYPEEEKSAFFRCIYIDPNPETKQPIVTVGQKEEYLFYREKIEDKFESYNKKMNEIVKDVRKEMKDLKELIKEKNLDATIIGQLLLNLRYLVKHIAFKEEQECRIVEILHLHNNEKIKIENDFKQMYFEYSPKVSEHIDRIYFGPKATGFELFKSMLKYNGLDKIQCEKSENPLA